MIYTSYFAKLKSLPKNVLPVSICGKAPAWYTGIQYKKLAPKYDFFIDWKRTNCYDSSLDEDRVCIHIDDCFTGIKNSLLSEVTE